MAEKISGIVHHSFYASKFIGMTIRVVIPEFDQVESLKRIIEEIASGFAKEVVVLDDRSAQRIPEATNLPGVTVLKAGGKGCENAFHCIMKYLKNPEMQTDIVVFLNGNDPVTTANLTNVVLPVVEDQFDLVIGSKAPGQKGRGDKIKRQPFRIRLAFTWILWRYGIRFTKSGSLGAIRFKQLKQMKLKGKPEDWLTEMQIKAAKYKWRCLEVPLIRITGNDQKA